MAAPYRYPIMRVWNGTEWVPTLMYWQDQILFRLPDVRYCWDGETWS